MIELATKGLVQAVDPKSADHLRFTENRHRQPLVDAAFLAEALMRSPTQLWGRLDKVTKKRLIEELKSSRSIEAY